MVPPAAYHCSLRGTPYPVFSFTLLPASLHSIASWVAALRHFDPCLSSKCSDAMPLIQIPPTASWPSNAQQPLLNSQSQDPESSSISSEYSDDRRNLIIFLTVLLLVSVVANAALILSMMSFVPDRSAFAMTACSARFHLSMCSSSHDLTWLDISRVAVGAN